MTEHSLRIVTVRRYLHDDSDELSDLWPPDAQQQEPYSSALYEVALDLEVNLVTGQSRIVRVNGVDLVDPGAFS